MKESIIQKSIHFLESIKILFNVDIYNKNIIKNIFVFSLFFIIFFGFTGKAFAATYYVDSVLGNDANNGTSINSAWKTISKVDSYTFNPGDQILFKRGDTWDGNNSNTLYAESGTAGNYITYGAYGVGDKPILTSSITRNETNDWEYEGKNIWASSNDISNAVYGPEMVLNPSFDSSLDNWNTYLDLQKGIVGTVSRATTTGDFYSSPAGYKLDVTTGGSSYTDIQTYISNMSIDFNKYYVLSFYTKASNDFDAKVLFMKSTYPYTIYQSNGNGYTVNITNEWVKHSFYFRSNVTASDLRINLDFGLVPNNTSIYLDSVSLKEIDLNRNEGILDSDVGNMIMSDKTKFGVKVWNESDLDTQGKYWYDAANNIIKIYSISNPVSYYGDIRMALNSLIINGTNTSYVIYDGLHLFAGGSLGIGGSDNSNIIIRNCDVSYIGGGDQVQYKVRYGNGIQFWRSAHDIYVYNNNLWQIYDAAISPQGNGDTPSSIYNLYFYNNVIRDAEYGIEFWERPAGTTVKNVHFENNTIVNSGGGWAHNQRPNSKNGRSLMFYYNPADNEGIFIRNNIFLNATESLIRVSSNSNWLATTTMNYNYFHNPMGYFVDFLGSNYTKLSDWNSLSGGLDLNSEEKDPLISNLSSNNFTLQQFSPAIDSGTNTGLSTDYAGNPIYGVPDIGAYEYQPPYTIGTNKVPTTGSIRIYSNGKYRMKTATSTAVTADFSVTPSGGNYLATTSQYMDITINKWETTGNKNKEWTASSSSGEFKTHATSTTYAVGDLIPNTYYLFKIDGAASTTAINNNSQCTNGICLSSSSGKIDFTYIGGYSTHTFDIEKYATSPSVPVIEGTSKEKISQGASLTFSHASSTIGIAKYQLYVDGILEEDNISRSAESVSLPRTYKCNEKHKWNIEAVDNNGNKTSSNESDFSIPCGAVSIVVNVPRNDIRTQFTNQKTASSTHKTSHVKDVTKQQNLTSTQVSAILSLLKSFGANNNVVKAVREALDSATTPNKNISFVFTTNLEMNDVGTQVKLLQEYLNAHGVAVSSKGYGSPGKETMYFGQATYHALVRYQKENGLPPTGWFGPMTRKLIEERVGV
ncbi:MAG TPA: hypothetical protein ENJ75_01885 [Candidatus Kaiserbacteria bacterium]|nr:hypothetical protein [Candidatus Kaiserbacteria bacterium]